MERSDRKKRAGEGNRTRGPELNSRVTVVLVRPENQENIGLVARAMKNTGFRHLRLIMSSGLGPKSYKTAVHAPDILKGARIFHSLKEGVADLNVLFAATARLRKNFPSIPLREAVEKMSAFPLSTKIGLLFGNERTGLTSEEMKSSNFRFMIPQASAQPSYNLAAAVLLVLFQIFILDFRLERPDGLVPLPQKDQEECIGRILDKLEKKRFIHSTNRAHVTEMVYDIFGRLAITTRDRQFLLALLSKGVDSR
ncbi:MAG: TrmH family RNA methyltransferase [Candidatus Aminicenantales bacterium]